MTTAALKKKIKAFVDQANCHKLDNVSSMFEATGSNVAERKAITEAVTRSDADLGAGRSVSGSEVLKRTEQALKRKRAAWPS